MIHTVRGPVQADALGVTLMHEHVLVDFAGAALVHPSRYDTDEAFALVLPHLRRLADHGCRTFVECTPSYLGRDPALLARLSEASGLNIPDQTGTTACSCGTCRRRRSARPPPASRGGGLGSGAGVSTAPRSSRPS